MNKIIVSCVLLLAGTLGFAETAKKHVTAAAQANAFFEENLGQFPTGQFVLRAAGLTGVIDRGGVKFAAGGAHPRLQWLHAQRGRLERGQAIPGYSTYYTSAGTKPIEHVPHLASVRASELYDGVTVVYRTASSDFEFDLVARPGTDISQPHFRVSGATQLKVDGDGSLRIQSAGREFVLHAPVAYQVGADGLRHNVRSSYQISGDTVGFNLGEYDRGSELVIDPRFSLGFATLIGSSAVDAPATAVTDPAGTLYLIGRTSGSDFAGVNGPGMFVAKYSSGARVDLLFYGDFGPSAADVYCDGVTSLCYLYVVGNASSAGLPILNAIQGSLQGSDDAYLAVFNAADLSPVMSSYLGGSGSDRLKAMAVAPDGTAYLALATTSNDFPTTSGAYQVLRPSRNTNIIGALAHMDMLHPALLHASYLGGTGTKAAGANSYGDTTGIALDGTGAVYVIGSTNDQTYPVTTNALQTKLQGNGYYPDISLARMSADLATLQYSTYFGGKNSDGASGVQVDSNGSIYFGGLSYSSNYPVTANAYSKKYNPPNDTGVFTRLDRNAGGGYTIGYSTFSPFDVDAFVVSAPGKAFIGGTGNPAGATESYGCGISSSYGDMLVGEFNTGLSGPSSLTFVGCIGGSGNNRLVSLRAGSAGALLLTGITFTTDFPTTDGTQLVGERDVAFVLLNPVP